MKNIKRLWVLIVCVAVIAAMFVLRLVRLQLVEGNDYYARSVRTVVTTSSVKPTRGRILDRYCQPLVYNTLSCSVSVNLSLVEDADALILNLVRLFDKTGDAFINTFPIVLEDGRFVYNDDYAAEGTLYRHFQTFLTRRNVVDDKDAEHTARALIQSYGLDHLSDREALAVVAVRFEMDERTSQSQFVFATDVSMTTASVIRENMNELVGVTVETTPTRAYSYDYFASHILGLVGRLDADEYALLKDKGYSYDDSVGKSGIEKVFESYLRGENGTRSTTTDASGNLISVVETTEPKPGDDVILTLDTTMQTLCESALEKAVLDARAQNGETAARSGAAIFMDVKSGEIFCMASWPTYNLSTYFEDFATVSKDPSSPYINRVISGLFPAGSTYKMITAAAALENHVLDEHTTYQCTGRYTYYEDYQPTCYSGNVHGVLDLHGALRVSCNCFFFDAARLTGIDVLNNYSAMFGFGKKTGIELTGESAGVVAGPAYRESIGGDDWRGGDTIQAAIGQSDGNVTPVQLVSYVAALANGGKKVSPHLVKTVRDSRTGAVVYASDTSYEQLPISQETLDIIMDGLFAVANEKGGTAHSYFKDFALVTVSVKSGTAEYAGDLPTTHVIGVAPADDPQIAFAVTLEHGGVGSNAFNANVIKSVLSYYFTKNTYEG